VAPGFLALAAHGFVRTTPVATVNAGITRPPVQLLEIRNVCSEPFDLVFIDPVGTGFSTAVGKAQNKDFGASIPTSSRSRNSSRSTSHQQTVGTRRNF